MNYLPRAIELVVHGVRVFEIRCIIKKFKLGTGFIIEAATLKDVLELGSKAKSEPEFNCVQ